MAEFNRKIASALLGAGALFVITPQVVFAQAAPKPLPAPPQSISAEDKAAGAKAHPDLLKEFGGAVTGKQAAYVEDIGKSIAIQSGLGNAKSEFTVTLLNSSVNNAFAIPGGYIYVTRELVGLMNNEAELAGVLGHEVGHVAAEHQKKRQATAEKNQWIGLFGKLLAAKLLGNNVLGNIGQQFFNQAPQLLTLKYSRGQETEADNLGIEYLRKAGYEPHAMGMVLQSLANQNALEATMQGSSTKVPTWASTHPADGPRVKAALDRAGTATGATNRDRFLAGINGIMFGDDPHQGVIDGRKFTHPDDKFAFEAPQGFYLVNGTRSVAISGQSAKGQLALAPYNGDLDAYVTAVFAGLDKNGQSTLRPASIQHTDVNGIPAAYGSARASNDSGTVDVVVFAYAMSPQKALHFLTVAQSGGADVFNPMFGSMRRISTAEAAAIKPRKISVQVVRNGDTIKSLAARMAYSDYQQERFLVLNGLTESSTLTPGQKIKLIVY